MATGAVAAAIIVAASRMGGGSDAPTPAVLEVTVQPMDARVSLNGQVLTEAIELDPGTHQVSVERDGYRSWSSPIEVSKGERRTLQVMLERIPAPEHKPAKAAPIASLPAKKATRSQDKPDARPADQADEEPRPITVSASKVKKRSGKMPVFELAPGQTLPSRVQARLCLDKRGKVTSAKLQTAINYDVRRDFEKALRKWRFHSVRIKGDRVPVCFNTAIRIER